MNARTRKKIAKVKKIITAPFINNPITKKKVSDYHQYMRSRVVFEGTPSIISSNCIGGIISHDLGLRFMSPTINLTIPTDKFFKFITNLNHYLGCELINVPEKEIEKGSPVGKIDDVEIVFVHYKTFEEAKEKWDKRKKRINFDNLYIMLPLGGLGKKELDAIKDIKCKRKIVFSPYEIPEYDFVFPMKQYKGKKAVGQFASIDIDGFRPYEKEFDYVAWLNGEEHYRTKYFRKYRSFK